MSNFAEKWRPTSFEELIGCPAALSLKGREVASVLLHGPSGVGKTTVALLWAKSLDADVLHINGAHSTGVADWRDIIDQLRLPTLSGRRRVIIVDEAHRISKQAFDSMLLPLETPPERCHFVFVTTAPSSIPKTIQTRCMAIKLSSLGREQLKSQLNKVAKSEGVRKDVLKACRPAMLSQAEGSMRKLWMLLELVAECTTVEDAVSRLSNRIEDGGVDASVAWVTRYLQEPGKARALCQAAAETEATAETIRQILLRRVELMLAKGAWHKSIPLILEEFQEEFPRPSDLYRAIFGVAVAMKGQ